ncbi:hypothetical protein AB664_12655 [Brucella anthropi]|uniref:Uncharacterized protein n=1 Tax=Brucella anthropi TaxID=529 RepID=A0A656Z6N2_BRUAN|nr:hypothetical protein AB664_12655 [Brucella anthropi]
MGVTQPAIQRQPVHRLVARLDIACSLFSLAIAQIKPGIPFARAFGWRGILELVGCPIGEIEITIGCRKMRFIADISPPRSKDLDD